MGPAELSDAGDEEREHDPHRQRQGWDGRYAIYFNCNTSLVENFRELYSGALTLEGNRAVILEADEPIPEAEVRHCLAMALTYHRDKRQKMPRGKR